MNYLLLACQLGLALVLILAATGKLVNSEQFRAALRLSHVPSTLISLISVLIPPAELCLAGALVLGTPRILPAIMISTALLLAAFTAWMYFVYSRGMRVRCGCFGTGGSEVGIRTILRNTLLILMALVGVTLALNTRSPLPALSLWWVMAVVSSSMAVMLIDAVVQSKHLLVFTLAQSNRDSSVSGNTQTR